MVALNASQSQQFTATGLCVAGVIWSMPAGSSGTLTSNGIYTAPSVIAAQQTVTITATSEAPTANTATATISLLPPVTISLTPGSVTLTGDQTQQFIASVANTNNTAVAWTITPIGTGAIDVNGVYTAPSSISGQQTVTITATSQEDPTKSASAMISLATTQCVSSGYPYQRVIVIDHTKVPNTDQTNFPFLFNTTDPDLAATNHGGHVTSLYGYDIIFSTDPNGLTKLDHEIDEYNPITGKMVAWIRIPTLSHTADTVVYVFYGNPNITTSQANPAGVWDRNYTAVYHLADAATNSASDSTVNGNSGTYTSVLAATGQIDGAASFDGSTSYLEIPPADFPSFPQGDYASGVTGSDGTSTFAGSFGIWFKTASPGGILVQTPAQICTSYFFGCVAYSPSLPTNWTYGGSAAAGQIFVDTNGNLRSDFMNAGQIVTTSKYNDNNWHFLETTYANKSETLYVDGQNVGFVQGDQFGYDSGYAYFVGITTTFLNYGGDWGSLYFNGNLDEISVSNIARSNDWVKTEYNNQGSPTTFYTFNPSSSVQVAPSAVSLYATQTQQFVAGGGCNNTVTWSMPANAQGNLSSDGLYTAPAAITTAQNVTITATNQVSGTTVRSSIVTLLPPPPPIALTAVTQSPYMVGTPQTFTAVLKDQYGNPQTCIAVSFSYAFEQPHD